MLKCKEGEESLLLNLFLCTSDTMGYAFTFPVVRILSGYRTPVGAYVHYPTISTDMLSRVKERKEGYANNASISSSVALSSAKLLYVLILSKESKERCSS